MAPVGASAQSEELDVEVDSFFGESFFAPSEDGVLLPLLLDSEELLSDDVDLSLEDPDGEVELDEDRLSFL